jgi:[protein-PII] uridylyltransferase
VSAPGKWATTPFSEQREALILDQSLQGPAFCRALADLVDGWLAGLLGEEPDVALVAAGGYGRGELAPGSDLDVILVHRGRRDIKAVADRIWYPIWDAKLDLDHSVKTVKEALAVAKTDLKAALGLLDARTIAGDPDLGGELVERARSQWQREARRWLRALGEAVAERHSRTGDVAFLLEPDLKEGRGGLRDVHALRAAARAVSFLPDDDMAVLDSSDVLVEARVALHRRTGKTGDQLTLQEQDGVAQLLGMDSADSLMQAISNAARTIAWCSDDAWRVIAAWLEGPGSRLRGRNRSVSPGVVLLDDVVVASAEADMADDSLALRVAAGSAQAGAPIARATLERLRAEASVPDERWSEAARKALVDLLGAGAGTIHAAEALDQYGLLVRILPEWESVRSRLQHNPYHRFTVDRHLLAAAAEAAALTDQVSRPDLLLVAAFLHDLGKGYEGDHTHIGTELIERIATRMGFPPGDVDILVALVRHHLLLADAATRRDVRDPTTITKVAFAVKDPLVLELLHALTEADSKATGPTAWGQWKAGLVDELVAKVSSALRGDGPAAEQRSLDPELAQLVDEAAGDLYIRATGPELVVVAPDRPGLFCQVAGVLSLHGLEIVAADAWPAPGAMAVEVFRVERTIGGQPNWQRFERDLSRALAGELALEARMAERAQTYAPQRNPRTRHRIPMAVTVDNDASDTASVVEVRGPDAHGFLYRVTRALLELQLDIGHAKVATLGNEVIDSFYVVDRRGNKLTDPGRMAELERGVLFELARLDIEAATEPSSDVQDVET